MTTQMDEFNAAAPAPKLAPKLAPKQDAEKLFRQMWIHTLSMAMMKTGKGFRMDSPNRRQPKGAAKWRGERRDDKVGTTKLSRQLLEVA